MRRIVLDTNVVVSALLSQRGASFRILSLVNDGSFQLSLSVPLVLEYEDVATRILTRTQLNTEDLNAILDYICLVGSRHLIHF
jgi:predicted nucleic acid-binding protein